MSPGEYGVIWTARFIAKCSYALMFGGRRAGRQRAGASETCFIFHLAELASIRIAAPRDIPADPPDERMLEKLILWRSVATLPPRKASTKDGSSRPDAATTT